MSREAPGVPHIEGGSDAVNCDTDDTNILRIPGYREGAQIGGEPDNWLLVDKRTGERLGVEWNPKRQPSLLESHISQALSKPQT